MSKRKFDIEGMTCATCQLTVENSVKNLGTESVNVSLLTNTMEVDDDNLSNDEIINAVENSGYKASIREDSKRDSENKETDKHHSSYKNPKEIYIKQEKDIKNRLIISIPLMIILMYIAMGQMINLPYPDFLTGYKGSGLFAFIQFLISIVVVYANRTYFISGYKALKNKHPNMDSLVFIGSFAAFIYGILASIMIFYGLGIQNESIVMEYRHDLYYEASTMILTLITLGKYLEVRSKSKTTDSINKLIELQPEKVRLVTDDSEEMVYVEDIKEGDLIKVKPGEKVAVDGFVVSGSSSIDTSLITGEPMPKEISKDDKVISGSVNNNGSFIMKATTVGSDTTISKIINLMEEASATKAPISKMADKISAIFVPIVIVISIISFIVWTLLGYPFTFSLSIAIGVLVISCPCALGLATPVSMMVATGKAAENGILIKNAEGLEILHKIDTIIFDKTGTITKGKPVLTDIAYNENIDKDEVVRLAHTLEKQSEHPLGLAIIEYANENNLEAYESTNFNSITGMGIEANINDKKYYIGNDKLMKKVGLDYNKITEYGDRYSKKGKTSVYLFDDDSLLAIFAISDYIKQSSIKAIKEINNMGIETIMLTGDNEITAKEIARQVGIKEVKAELLPQDKDKIVTEYAKDDKLVCMVGDGINDAPALMRSDIGIAIADGTDIAIESADMVLMKSNLLDIVSAIKLSEKTIKNIKQNLFWAFIYNVISIPIAMGIFYPAFGLKLNPMIGALAMSLSSVFVVTNSLRLRRFKIENIVEKEESNLSLDVNYDKINLVEKNNNIRRKEEKNMTTKTIDIKGMSCAHCKKNIEDALSKFSNNVEVSLEENNAKVELNEDVKDSEIIQAIEDKGYEVEKIS